jgi:hypothetical protein
VYLEFHFILVKQADDNDYEHYYLQYEVDVYLKVCPSPKDSCQYNFPQKIIA